MSSLKNGAGELLTEQRDILKETVNYYTNLYTANDNLNKNEQQISQITFTECYLKKTNKIWRPR